MPKLNDILEKYSDHNFFVVHGHDDAIIGMSINDDEMRLVYSVNIIIDKLSTMMSNDEAVDYFYYNIIEIGNGYINKPIFVI